MVWVKLTQECMSLLTYLSVHKKGEEFGGEAQGTVPGWFHLAAPEALVACSCPCQVLRPGPYPPPTVISCLNSNCQGLTHGLLQVWEGWICLSPAAWALPTPGNLPSDNGQQ